MLRLFVLLKQLFSPLRLWHKACKNSRSCTSNPLIRLINCFRKLFIAPRPGLAYSARMSRTSLKDWPCAFARAADIIGDQWSLLILRDAFYGVNTWSGFQRSLKVARNVLADRLERLTDAGILERKPVRPGAQRYTYELTEAGHEFIED